MAFILRKKIRIFRGIRGGWWIGGMELPCFWDFMSMTGYGQEGEGDWGG